MAAVLGKAFKPLTTYEQLFEGNNSALLGDRYARMVRLFDHKSTANAQRDVYLGLGDDIRKVDRRNNGDDRRHLGIC